MNWHLDLLQSWQISCKTWEVVGHELHIVASAANLAVCDMFQTTFWDRLELWNSWSWVLGLVRVDFFAIAVEEFEAQDLAQDHGLRT